MSKKFFIISIISFLICAISGNAFAQEQITITTYYPSPYGSYQELRAQRMAIGNNYINRSAACWDPPCPGSGVDISDTPTRDIDLIVEGSVGIGTAGPGAPLEIASSTDNILRLRQTDSPTSEWNYIEWYDSTARQYWTGVDNLGNFRLNPQTGTGLVLTTAGNVGIGTTSPAGRLHVQGVNDAASVVTFMPGQNTAAAGTPDMRVGIGTTAPVNRLDVEGGVAVGATYSGANTAPTNGMIIQGNVGIGTTSPTVKLDVSGDINTGGHFEKNGIPVIQCNWDGLRAYWDEGGGNDFGVICRNGVIERWCHHGGPSRGYYPGVYSCP